MICKMLDFIRSVSLDVWRIEKTSKIKYGRKLLVDGPACYFDPRNLWLAMISRLQMFVACI